MVKDAPNNILMNMICSSQTSHEILKDGDILIFLVVLITPARMVPMPGNKLVAHYPPSAWRLIQSIYHHTFSYSVLNMNEKKIQTLMVHIFHYLVVSHCCNTQ